MDTTILTFVLFITFGISIILYLIFNKISKIFYNHENKKVFNIFLTLSSIFGTIMVYCLIYSWIVILYILCK